MIKVALCIIALITGMYLGGAFIALDFDFRNWVAEGRVLFLICVAVYSTLIVSELTKPTKHDKP